MKKCLFVLMVCLMATSTYATNSWVGPSGSWSDGTMWTTGMGVPNDSTSQGEIKILKTTATSCTIDDAAGNFTTAKLTVGGSSKGSITLNIVNGGSIGLAKEFIVGSGTGGGQGSVGTVVQTGGSVVLNVGATAGKLEIGYKSGSTGIGKGYYTISGGTLTGTGNMYVGAFAGAGTGGTSGAQGTFTVVGKPEGMDVSVGDLYVGVGDVTGVYTGTGTLEFQVVNGVVTPITATNVYIDPAGQALAITNLIVSKTSGDPAANILLVKNTGVAAVDGAFDNITLDGAFLGYTVSYVFDSVSMTDGGGNDIALVPEPVTIALLGLGFLAVRRNRK